MTSVWTFIQTEISLVSIRSIRLRNRCNSIYIYKLLIFLFFPKREKETMWKKEDLNVFLIDWSIPHDENLNWPVKQTLYVNSSGRNLISLSFVWFFMCVWIWTKIIIFFSAHNKLNVCRSASQKYHWAFFFSRPSTSKTKKEEFFCCCWSV